ncbi:MAG: HTH domain-containing protein [Candidatus Woesearchaeota archaeon]|nr:HTH domain-containing protein [Candidatus Woesearchaeota archaeon]
MKIEIVENIREKMKIDNKYVGNILKGKKIDGKRAEKTIVITPEIFSKIFSPERIKLMLKIKRNNIKNIYQLAKQLNRKYEAVYRDIKLLEGLGIIKLKDKDRKKIPLMDEPITIPELAAC